MTLVPVPMLRTGDVVDLEGDAYADPERRHICFQFEGAVVIAVERESAACVAVTFEGFDTVGFPTGHLRRSLGREGG